MKLPEEVFVQPENKAVLVTPEISAIDPRYDFHFVDVDHAYDRDREAYLDSMAESVHTFVSSTGAEITYSLLPANSDKVLVVYAPFADGPPLSSADAMSGYAHPINRTRTPKNQAQPNTWSQITKSSVYRELLKAQGYDVNVLTLFSPMPTVPHKAYTHAEYDRIRLGDFSPSARIAAEALADAQDRLHGPKRSPDLYPTDFLGASLGASAAIGAAAEYAATDESAVQTVTAQELIMGPATVVPGLLLKYARDNVDVPRDEQPKPILEHILHEPKIRAEIDRDGNEVLGLALRTIRAASKVTQLKGLTRPHRNQTANAIAELNELGVSVAVPLAENSGVSQQTAEFLPGAGEEVIRVRSLGDTKDPKQRVGHIMNEYVALSGLLATLHIRKSRMVSGS